MSSVDPNNDSTGPTESAGKPSSFGPLWQLYVGFALALGGAACVFFVNAILGIVMAVAGAALMRASGPKDTKS
jgi:hypothetical protein